MSDTGPPIADERRDSWWFVVCAIALIVASDFKLRVRDPGSATGGQLDSAVLAELGIYALVGLYLFAVHGRPIRIRRTELQIFLACWFVGLIILSVAYSAYPEYAIVRAGQMGVLLGLTLVSARVATRRDMHRFAHTFIALVLAAVTLGSVVSAAPVSALQAGRFTWLAVHPTVSGVFCGLAAVLAATYLGASSRPRPGPRWPRGWYLIAVVVTGGATLATQTRGAVIATLVATVVGLAALRTGREVLRLQTALVFIAVAVTLAAGGLVQQFFERGESAERLASLNSRTDLWGLAADAVAQRPMFGYGVTAARGIFVDAVGLGGGHNALVNVWVELGTVGVISWLALVVVLIKRTRRLPTISIPEVRSDRALLLAVVTYLLVDGFFYEGPGAVTNVAITWLFLSVAWLTVARRVARHDLLSPDRDRSDDDLDDFDDFDPPTEAPVLAAVGPYRVLDDLLPERWRQH